MLDLICNFKKKKQRFNIFYAVIEYKHQNFFTLNNIYFFFEKQTVFVYCAVFFSKALYRLVFCTKNKNKINKL